MLSHSHHLWDNGIIGPSDSENLGKLFQVLGSCLSNRENSVPKPAHAKRAKLLIKELYAQLTCKQWNIFYYG